MKNLLVILCSITILCATHTITTKSTTIKTPFSSDSLLRSYKISMDEGVSTHSKRYVYRDCVIEIVGDTLRMNDLFFAINGEHDTLVINDDTLYVSPRSEEEKQEVLPLHRSELLSHDFYLDISLWKNSNSLVRSEQFKQVLNDSFKDRRWYLYYDGLISKQICAGLGGAPSPIEIVDSNVVFTESFRSGSAMEKAAVFINRSTKEMAIAMICFFDSPQRESRISPEKRAVSFYSTPSAQQNLEKHVQEWINDK